MRNPAKTMAARADRAVKTPDMDASHPTIAPRVVPAIVQSIRLLDTSGPLAHRVHLEPNSVHDEAPQLWFVLRAANNGKRALLRVGPKLDPPDGMIADRHYMLTKRL